ncbi:MAG: phosphoglucomutase/phosphomannomutase family protein, partial [Proteobacteria bacterium]|nr:phosphoglucomutase/phosphomannomutase family protein [Pseudomonadota bacterium]
MKIKFGTDGFRGYIGKDFTFDNALKVADMALSYFKKKNQKNTVAIGYDTRFLSKEVASEIAERAKTFGYNVFLSESFIPSPALSLYIHQKKHNFGFMITASHNPPQFNGVKIKENFGGSALSSTIEAIAKSKVGLDKTKNGSLCKVEIKDYYISYLKKTFPIEHLSSLPLKIIVNPMYGAGQGILEEIFKGSTLIIKEINNIINPSFGGINP